MVFFDLDGSGIEIEKKWNHIDSRINYGKLFDVRFCNLMQIQR